MKENYSVYKLTSPEGKIYIGCTGEDPKVRWSKRYCHNYDLTNDIKKFGWHNFEHDVVATGMTSKEAYDLEKELIHKYDSTNPEFGYNISTGGYGRTGCYFSHTEEAKEKIRLSSLGRRHTEETKRKLSEARMGAGNPMYGRHPSEETLRKLSEARRGQHHSEEARRKIGEVHRKRVLCVETNKIYDSITQAAAEYNCSISNIIIACNSEHRKARGYHWVYVD